MNASTKLSMNGKSPMISPAPPFVLSFSKDERRVFQQNHIWDSAEKPYECFGEAQHERKISNDFNCSSVRPEALEG